MKKEMFEFLRGDVALAIESKEEMIKFQVWAKEMGLTDTPTMFKPFSYIQDLLKLNGCSYEPVLIECDGTYLTLGNDVASSIEWFGREPLKAKEVL